MTKYRRTRRMIAAFLLVQFVTQTFSPAVSFALTSGPSQPEFSSFEPVTTTNLVDEFTGDFTYNIPLIEVPGPSGGSYPLSISYHSGATPEEEASWVGYGWTLNAGAVNRNVRGIPDDSKGDAIDHWNRTPTNWTATLGAGVTFEAFSKDAGMLSPSFTATYRYNNFRGFGLMQKAGVILGRGLVDMGFTVDEGTSSFSLNVSPMAILNHKQSVAARHAEKAKHKEFSGKEMFRSSLRGKAKATLSNLTNVNAGSRYGIFHYNQVSPMPTYVSAYNGASITVSGAFDVDPSPLEVGLGFNLLGSYSWQRNQEFTPLLGYGYLYSSLAPKTALMDFHYEKDNAYDKQDEYIGLPFNDADSYMATGEGIAGGFRLQAPTVGQFGTTEVNSSYQLFQISPEFEAGLNWGGGVDVGVGSHSLFSTDWMARAGTNGFTQFLPANTEESYFFRFNNDMGGSWGDKYDDKPQRFSLDASGNPTSGGVNFSINNGVRSGRSSYIGFNTNNQISTDALQIKRFSKTNTGTFVDRSKNPNAVGEISIQNADGMRYNYGIPVYGKEESSLTFGLNKVPSSAISKNYVAYQKSDSETKVGQVRHDPYAYSYLMTEILTQDYLDKADDGPTSDDMGGYVKFGYNKVYGDQSDNAKWFNWRIPYNGVLYQRNSMSDKRDDMGTLVSGQKEIYFLKTIETKSHVALFYFSDRNDGLGALDDEAAMTQNAKSTDRLKKLDKVELYSIASMGALTRDASGNILPPPTSVKPIKTAYFIYAASGSEVMPGAPNTDASRGKLTLKKIYFEYNGIVQTKTSPYLFDYKYPTVAYPGGTTTKYDTFDDFGSDVRTNWNWTNANPCSGTVEDPENPKYSPFNVDAWGNYQPNGCSNYDSMRTWLNQKKVSNWNFDPAPWTLKKINLPSGGEIHVQYEQDDYQYVQDQDAHVMVPLLNTGSSTDSKIYVDVKKLGLDPANAPQMAVLKGLINQRYGYGSSKRMYFKFLYQLKGASTPDLLSCNSEYITGYSKIALTGLNEVDAGADGIGFYITLTGDKTPKDVCKEFANTNVIGRLNESSDCSRSADMMADNDGGGSAKALSVVKAFAEATASALGNNLFSLTYCQQVNPGLSYLRIPTVNPKKGGGIRVKRLLMYDNSTDGPVLYGNNYSYVTTDAAGRAISSGVATNEPPSIREENILVEYLPKKDQSWANRMIAGKDKEVSEGPLGETVYPGASVGYSRVIVSNIYTGKTNQGFSVSDYYTAKDFPVTTAKTEIGGKSKTDIQFGLFANKLINSRSAVQGFSIILNNMHGQVREKSSWAGNFVNGVNLPLSSCVTDQLYDYFAPGEGVPVMSSLYGSVTFRTLGREVDFSMGQRSIHELNTDGNVEVDLTAGFFGFLPLPMFNAMPSITTTDALLNTQATTKVVRYPATVKKITTYQDGIYHTDEYAAFDEISGKPIAVKSEDEFTGAYLKQSIPAAWEYPNFGQKATNVNKTILTPTATINPKFNGRYALNFTSNGCTYTSQFATGDLVKLSGSLNNLYYRIESIDYNGDGMQLVSTRYNTNPSDLISPTSVYQMEILQSGMNNQLGVNAGNIVFHDPVKANMDPADFTDASRYISTTLTTDIQTGFNAAPTTFTLASTYSNVNMSAYAYYSPACGVDWSNASVKNLAFSKVTNANSISLILSSFDIQCTSGWVTINKALLP